MYASQFVPHNPGCCFQVRTHKGHSAGGVLGGGGGASTVAKWYSFNETGVVQPCTTLTFVMTEETEINQISIPSGTFYVIAQR